MFGRLRSVFLDGCRAARRNDGGRSPIRAAFCGRRKCIAPEALAAAEMVADRPGNHRITLGAADKAYDAAEFVADLREYNVTPHVAQNTTNRRSAHRRSDNPPPWLRGQWVGTQAH
jgi:hypothetical protein